ncbi:MAG: undecaprenyl-phosphate glucose phosphotransferase, partial [Flavobacteriales bacterium]
MKRSYFIIPISVFFHIFTINLILYWFTPDTYTNGFSILYYNIAWFMVTYSINFYPTARRDGFTTNLGNFLRLFLIYGFVYYTSFAFKDHLPYS